MQRRGIVAPPRFTRECLLIVVAPDPALRGPAPQGEHERPHDREVFRNAEHFNQGQRVHGVEGEALAEGERDAETELDGDTLAELELDGLVELDGLTELELLDEGLVELLGLLELETLDDGELLVEGD